ncbi:hypothetical protein Ndes2526B_g00267 [Nannochloris sp. 'desiccata']|nr:hypothetical protein KSW81_003070 [Chlorella desiccata (nom. nud.)]KAH7624896.1 hypothetical protein NADE_002117 [Chlorella desiccata (nom. nud.)]
MEQPPKIPPRSEIQAQQEESVAAEPVAEELVDQENDEMDQVLVNGEDLQGADLSEMGAWVLQTLQEQQPDAEITLGSVQALTDMLDGITSRILEEARRISHGEGPSTADGEEGGSDGISTAAPSTCTLTSQALTSQDIHKALKRLLPGEPGDPLRPYLPTVTKQAWHLDKQSLKGIKRKKGNTAAAAANTTNTSSVAAVGGATSIPSVQENVSPSE